MKGREEGIGWKERKSACFLYPLSILTEKFALISTIKTRKVFFISVCPSYLHFTSEVDCPPFFHHLHLKLFFLNLCFHYLFSWFHDRIQQVEHIILFVHDAAQIGKVQELIPVVVSNRQVGLIEIKFIWNRRTKYSQFSS